MTGNSLALKPDAKELRSFGLVTGGMIAGIFGLLIPWIWSLSWPLWPWITGAVLAVWGLLAPKTLAPVFRIWMKFAHVIGWINTRLLLGLVFYVLILPFGLVRRLVAADPMARRFDDKLDSYRKSSKQPSPEFRDRPF